MRGENANCDKKYDSAMYDTLSDTKIGTDGDDLIFCIEVASCILSCWQ